MAASSEENLKRVWRGFMRWLNNQYRDGSQPGYLQPSKIEWYNAIVAADAWADGAAAGYNQALPNPVRTQAPTQIKVFILICVLVVRYAPELTNVLRRWISEEVD